MVRKRHNEESENRAREAFKKANLSDYRDWASAKNAIVIGGFPDEADLKAEHTYIGYWDPELGPVINKPGSVVRIIFDEEE